MRGVQLELYCAPGRFAFWDRARAGL